MIRRIILLLLFSRLMLQAGSCYPHVYFIYYATAHGETGHSGIAVDTYKTIVVEKSHPGGTTTSYDSVRTGKLTYYDLWPLQDYFEKKLINEDKTAHYYKLPRASWEPEITLHSLLVKGIPHREGYPVDGLLQVTTTATRDRQVCVYLDSLLASSKPFNAISYNCADFAKQALEFITGKKIRAREFVWAGFSTTPNKLFRKAQRLGGIKILKDPGDLVQRSFLWERIIRRELLHLY